MCTETEAKLKVDSLEAIGRRLEWLGAEFSGDRLQMDSYFDSAQGTLKRSGKGLRIRRQKCTDDEKAYLTYKGAAEAGKFKRRGQLEVEVGDADLAERLLLAIGYEKILVFEKRRRLWRFKDCDIGLDEMPLLGAFVEIEGENEEQISEVQKDLGLGELVHIKESYLYLLKNKLRQLGDKRIEIPL